LLRIVPPHTDGSTREPRRERKWDQARPPAAASPMLFGSARDRPTRRFASSTGHRPPDSSAGSAFHAVQRRLPEPAPDFHAPTPQVAPAKPMSRSQEHSPYRAT